MVAAPWVLGDDYDELIENLSRLADAGLMLAIAKRNSRLPRDTLPAER
jgi:hypothetical protein